MLSSTTPQTLSDLYMPSAGAPWTGLSASLLSPLAKSNSYPNVASSLSSSTPMAMTNPPGGTFRQGFSSSTPYPPPDCYTGCDNTSLSMLHDKINMQSKGIENLTNTVRRLEEERNFYYRTVRDLRDELTHLNRHVTDNRGDAHSDQKVELWQREVTQDIHSLQQQVRSRGTDDNASSQVAALARDLHELKIHLHDECESMKRTIDGVKSRLGKVEMDVNVLRSGNADLTLKQQMAEECTLKMTNGHKSVAAEVSRMVKDRKENKLDITELKSSLRTVRAKLGHIEARMYAGVGTPGKVPHGADFDNLLSPDTSDLDLDLSSSDGGGFDGCELDSHDFTMSGDDVKLKPGTETFLESADLDLSTTDLTSGDPLDINDLT
ncbi:hypothetical protein NP493_43g00030 [Ridgeia piscesae]|uniref:Uncharacterized protein n=1 Tax=Ridgeia piscesae TaxID=27915 RepID=A0AAD9UJQ5_RIDPI|nr:hypothetical protein NP493_43g00030 [Ridgeia piscesae]